MVRKGGAHLSHRVAAPMPYPDGRDQEPAIVPSGGEVMEQPGAVQRLIRERLAATGQSFRIAADRGGLPKSTLYELATRQVRRKLDDETIAALANAIKVPLATIRSAEAQDLGVVSRTDTSPGDALLLRMLAELAPDKRRYIKLLVEAMWADQTAGRLDV